MDESIFKLIQPLFENYVIYRQEYSKLYFDIRQRQLEVSRILQDLFGLKLTIQKEFIMVRHIPLEVKPYMAINEFKEVNEYVFLMLLMAIIDTKRTDESFYLGEIVKDIVLIYPDKETLDWSMLSHRKSLVSALKRMTEMGIIKLMDGMTEDFDTKYSKDEEQPYALYELGDFSKFFFNNQSRIFDNFIEYQTFVEFKNDLVKEQRETLTLRQRVYRQLIENIAIPFNSYTSEDEFVYMRRSENERSLKSFWEQTEYDFELYKDMAFLSSEKNSSRSSGFPTRMQIDEIILQLAGILRNKDNHEINARGEKILTYPAWEKVISQQLIKSYDQYWTVEFRGKGFDFLNVNLKRRLQEICFIKDDQEEELITIYPIFVRIIGEIEGIDG
ncbi:DUF2398 family protein [Enterococcus sp. LJL98]